MATTSPTLLTPKKPLEDPLAHLPCSRIVGYRKGQMIYNQDQPSTSIYLVIDGKVKVPGRRWSPGGRGHLSTRRVLGESAFLGLPHRTEISVALENTKVMTWTTAEIEDITMRRPKLAIALLQLLVSVMDFGFRSKAFRWTTSRGVWPYARFASRSGLGRDGRRLGANDSVHPRTLSQYVGGRRAKS